MYKTKIFIALHNEIICPGLIILNTFSIKRLVWHSIQLVM